MSDQASPYRFLDAYGEDDAELFFGRDKEVRTLLADVLVNRLVVLFARTGTGKTSIIRAGVRPQLEHRGYRTFVVRVSQDPIRSARAELAGADDVPPLPRRALSQQLSWLSRTLNKPVVVFFDQFEEFFVYLMHASPDRFARFIREVARVREDPDIHLVFSMREEFFVEMDAFRDEIPSIFHADSNLRLQGFDPEAARDAIARPAETAGGVVQDALVERIIRELAEGGRVEPARLQIVCHTLWREAADKTLLVSDYERLGGASEIVQSRLREDVRRLDDAQLRLFERLIPELRTSYGTKYLRGVAELAERLAIPFEELDALVSHLKDGHLIRESVINRERYVEWASDYLAERTEDLRVTARVTLYRNLLEGAIRATGAPPAARTDDARVAELAWLAAQDPDSAARLTREDFDGLSEALSQLAGLGGAAAAFGFGMALQLRSRMREWFAFAAREGVEVWRVLERVLAKDSLDAPALNAVDLLGDLSGERRALELLERALEDPATLEVALAALTRGGDDGAVQALERATRDAGRAGVAIAALQRVRTGGAIAALARVARRGDATAYRAAVALRSLSAARVPGADPPKPSPLAARAESALNATLDDAADELFASSLEDGVQAGFWFEQAQRRSVDVWAVLREAVSGPSERAAGALELLNDIGGPQAAELLALAAGPARVREAAVPHAATPPLIKHPRGLGVRDDGLSERDWDVVIARVERARCLPIIGPGADAGRVPLATELAQEWAYRYGYPLEDQTDLARVATYLAIRNDALYPKELLAQSLRQRDATGADSGVYTALAALPLPVYLTTSYVTSMVDALRACGRMPRVELCWWNQSFRRSPPIDPAFQPTIAEPLVFHLLGQVDEPESLVLTEDDYLDFLVALSARRDILPHQINLAIASYSPLLIGFRIGDWPFRVLWRGIMAAVDASLRRLTLAVQLPSDPEGDAYVTGYLARMAAKVYWGTSEEFADELLRRFEGRAR